MTDPRPITRRETRPEWLDMAHPVFSDFYDFDPCWVRWLRLWKDTLGYDWDPRISAYPPAMVTTHDGRWRIKDELERRLDEPGSMGLDCIFEGSVDCVFSWTRTQKYQFEAIQFACRQIIAAGLVDMTVEVP